MTIKDVGHNEAMIEKRFMEKELVKEITITNDTRHLSYVRKTVSDLIRGSEFLERDINLVTIAVDEALANVIEHAYKDVPPGEKEIEISARVNSDLFEIIIRDTGIGFDSKTKGQVDIEEHVHAGKKSGLGVFMIKKIMDEVHYGKDTENKNELKLVKYATKKQVGL